MVKNSIKLLEKDMMDGQGNLIHGLIYHLQELLSNLYIYMSG